MRGQSPEEAIVDMVIEDNHRIQCIYLVCLKKILEKNTTSLGIFLF